MHGAGSPAAQKIMIGRRSGIERKRQLAETIAGIKRDGTFERIVGRPEAAYWQETMDKLRAKKAEAWAKILKKGD